MNLRENKTATWMEYYSAIKKNEFMKFLGKWMDLEGTTLFIVSFLPSSYFITYKNFGSSVIN